MPPHLIKIYVAGEVVEAPDSVIYEPFPEQKPEENKDTTEKPEEDEE